VSKGSSNARRQPAACIRSSLASKGRAESTRFLHGARLSNGAGLPTVGIPVERAANITRENFVILARGGVLMLFRLVFLTTVTLSGQLVFAQDIKTVLAASRRAGYLAWRR